MSNIYQLPESGTKVRWRFRSAVPNPWREGTLRHRDFKTKKVYLVGPDYTGWVFILDFVFEVL